MCTLEKRGDLFHLTLTGDDEHRFHPDTIASVLSLLEQAKSQSTKGSVLITTGHGKFFSNGFDLAWAQSAGHGAIERMHQMVKSFKPVLAALLDLPMPTIAALNGHAAASGLMFALSHDYVFMRKDRGVLYMSEVDIGLPVPDYFSALVVAKVGSGIARRELLLSGKKLKGEDAVALGIVDSAAHDSAEGVVEATVSLGESLAAKKWNGEVYASIRRSLYPELCRMLELTANNLATHNH
ncbi:Enoyl-CoA hydratase/isomerase [Arabidopsis thaliana x Arabidopsis arenosa]|uniref:Delta(3)-Delta(2)-enoyl-CoA isomerase n=1 Tax=Arabidopsis thaliana x Arabidopsis arenosa TaxID=1240361 RepID=A0A8T1YAR3_9BRAS|nr:Enoyl-CoA hydratase/isomerase [Arabidopsis thaliana x Arabidopsis arenosa]